MNIFGPDGGCLALAGTGAEGVGLYRTEVPFLLRDRFPSEEEQRQMPPRSAGGVRAVVTMRRWILAATEAYAPIEEQPFPGLARHSGHAGLTRKFSWRRWHV
ncbi:MAG: putative PEP-binding protein [Halioglobus sp.]